jgi:hypothetical protein
MAGNWCSGILSLRPPEPGLPEAVAARPVLPRLLRAPSSSGVLSPQPAPRHLSCFAWVPFGFPVVQTEIYSRPGAGGIVSDRAQGDADARNGWRCGSPGASPGPNPIHQERLGAKVSANEAELLPLGVSPLASSTLQLRFDFQSCMSPELGAERERARERERERERENPRYQCQPGFGTCSWASSPLQPVCRGEAGSVLLVTRDRRSWCTLWGHSRSSPHRGSASAEGRWARGGRTGPTGPSEAAVHAGSPRARTSCSLIIIIIKKNVFPASARPGNVPHLQDLQNCP